MSPQLADDHLLRVLVVGGGSAGHVIPALPIISALQAQGHKVGFVGTTSGLEEALVAPNGIEFFSIAAGKLRRYWSWQNLTDLTRIGWGICQSLMLLRRFKPDVVFSKGGFVSFPVALAAWFCRVPVVAHESDLTLGLANRLVLPFANTLCVSFAHSKIKAGKVRIVHTGTPLRSEILDGDAKRGRERLKIDGTKPLLVITGGSLGADKLNAVARDALPSLLETYTVLHVCGAGKMSDTQASGYIQREFIDEGWGDILAAADIVLSRAGANALFELLALKKLNLLIPLSAAASRGDQIDNAYFAEAQGFSAVLSEGDLNALSLVQALQALQSERTTYEAALQAYTVPDAEGAIVAEIRSVVP